MSQSKVENVSADQRPKKQYLLSDGQELVEDVEYLLPIKFCQIQSNRCIEKKIILLKMVPSKTVVYISAF